MKTILALRSLGAVSATLVLVGCGASAPSKDRMAEDRMIVRPTEDLKFETQPDGTSIAVISGDPATGPSVMFKKYKSGPIPMHSHPSGYHAVVLQGTAKHWAQGVTEANSPPLRPGSYWFQPPELIHTDACVDVSGECIIFVQNLGRRGFIPAEPAKK